MVGVINTINSSVSIRWHHNVQHIFIQHNDIQQNDPSTIVLFVTLSINDICIMTLSIPLLGADILSVFVLSVANI
jgi:hypothetical protein